MRRIKKSLDTGKADIFNLFYWLEGDRERNKDPILTLDFLLSLKKKVFFSHSYCWWLKQQLTSAVELYKFGPWRRTEMTVRSPSWRGQAGSGDRTVLLSMLVLLGEMLSQVQAQTQCKDSHYKHRWMWKRDHGDTGEYENKVWQGSYS